jgi:hypothetical protein
LPLLAGRSVAWRKAFLYAYWQEAWLPGVPGMLGVRTDSWKYVRYPALQDIDELYDLRADPDELRNLVADPASGQRLAELNAELERLAKEVGLDAATEFRPVGSITKPRQPSE